MMARDLPYREIGNLSFDTEKRNMEMKPKSKTPVIWRTTYEELKKRWKICFVLINLFYLTLIVSMGWSFLQDEKTKESLALQKEEFGT